MPAAAPARRSDHHPEQCEACEVVVDGLTVGAGGQGLTCGQHPIDSIDSSTPWRGGSSTGPDGFHVRHEKTDDGHWVGRPERCDTGCVDDLTRLLIAARDGDRDALERFVVETQVLGLQYDEAAEVLGCPIGTIRSRVARARGDLVAMMREPGDHADGAIVR